MNNRFMISVAAAALIAGAGFANAQGTGTGQQGTVGRSSGSAERATRRSVDGASSGSDDQKSTPSSRRPA